MKRINKAVVDKEAPLDSSVFWVDIKDPKNPALKINIDGVWKAVAGSSEGSDSGDGGDDSGGSEDAIKYTEQTLTETQQMQARKNQGLYYSETVPAQTISWDGTTTDRDWFEFKGNGGGGGSEI